MTTTSKRRRYVLAAFVAAVGIATSAILLEVLGTIVLAVTVAFVLAPVHRWCCRRGLSKWWAGIAATVVGFLGLVAALSPIMAALYFRREQLQDVIGRLPSEVTITLFESSMTITAVDVQALATEQVRTATIALATAAPELAVKLALFGILLFAILLEGDAAVRAIIAPVPYEYRDVVVRLGRRAHETLYAIYVLQIATAAATFAVAVPLFWVLDYRAPFVLGIVAAVLQFVPIVGPSFLILPMAIYQVAVGDITAAVLVGVLGMVLIAWLPDTVVRPRLARRTADLPGSLYFVGFTGGLFTLGPIGIVVGPLVVSVFTEAVDLLAAEINADEMPSLEGPAALADSVSETRGERDSTIDGSDEGGDGIVEFEGEADD